MNNRVTYQEAQQFVLKAVRPVGTEKVLLENSFRRVLAQDLTAAENVPAFDRSSYDGYAFRTADTADASAEHPVTLHILEEIAAGGLSTVPVTEGMAVRLMTGAPIPQGADAVCKYEDTVFTEEEVTLSFPVRPGNGIIHVGEDVQAGSVLAEVGSGIDAGILGLLAAQRAVRPEVFRVPVVGVLSTGSELIEADSAPEPGKICNTNRYTISAALDECGCRPKYLGIVEDSTEKVSAAIMQALKECDALVMTGGVSVGKYDYTMRAMEQAGAEILFNGVKMKPGMACTYGTLDGKLIAGLSGNPAASLTNFYVIAAPAFRKLCGQRLYMPEMVRVTLLNRFPKNSPETRILRGKLDLTEGTAGMRFSEDQGNMVLRSMAGSDVMAIVPAGSGPQEAGTVLDGFLL